jgi:hypothetical protein
MPIGIVSIVDSVISAQACGSLQGFVAGTTGLEPATSAVTGQRSNQLSYVPRRSLNNLGLCHVE